MNKKVEFHGVISYDAPVVSEKHKEYSKKGKGHLIETSDRISSRASNPLRFKTELCRSYEENGTCRFAEACTFAHGTSELRAIPRHPRYKTELCNTYHRLGYCQYGSRCHFIHTPEDLSSANMRNLSGYLYFQRNNIFSNLANVSGDYQSYIFLSNLKKLCALNGFVMPVIRK